MTTGLASVPPAGPAKPVTDSPNVVHKTLRAPIAISRATASLTAPSGASRSGDMPSNCVCTSSVSPTCELDVLDRVGGGDEHAAGFLYGLLLGKRPEECVRLGWAHGTLLTTFP